VTCDGFAGLRALIDPEKRKEKARLLSRYSASRRMPAIGGGRWSLLRARGVAPRDVPDENWLEPLAELYLRRYGIVFRDLLARELFAPSWRKLLAIYRRGEARGELRAGRFVDGVIGEQFALPEAIDALRAVRKTNGERERVTISSADPLNLAGVVVPGTRIPSTLGRHIRLEAGVPIPLEGEPPGAEEREAILLRHA
jgi:ATP-dependent Lhr-like helicase